MNPAEHRPERPLRLFIAYAPENQASCDRLKIHLSPMQRSGALASVHANPAGLFEEIETAMRQADVALFLLDEYALASGFYQDTETPDFLQRQRKAGMLILFVVAGHCRWKDFDYIAPINTHPITSYTPHGLAYTHIAELIEKAIIHHPRRAEMAAAGCALTPSPLSCTQRLAGREAELEQLSIWLNQKGVCLLVAEDGMGKSALINAYLKLQFPHDGARLIVHTICRHESSRRFLLDVLRRMDVAHDPGTTDEELGRMFACAVASKPALLVLENIESMQNQDGNLNDRGLIALLEELLQRPGLCIASSSLPIADAGISREKRFHQQILAPLPPDTARALLRQRGVRGDDAELGRMAKRCSRHPLSLVLAAEFCHCYLQDNAAAFIKHAWYPNTEKANVDAIAIWFDNKLADEHLALDRELLRIESLFDRPAPWGALLALKQAKAIPQLTATLHSAGEANLAKSLARLVQWGLLDCDLACREPEFAAPPQLHKHFGSQLKKEAPKAWQAAHSILFDWFCSRSVQPDTPDEMAPLYRAIFHGCQARRYRSAYETIYLGRILRGSAYYSQNQLGAYSCDLNALAEFFPQGWNKPPVTSDAGLPGETLSEVYRSKLLSDAAFALKSLGMLNEALGPQYLGHLRTREAEDWNNFCRSSENLVSMLTPLGHWIEAEAVSREAVTTAGRIQNEEERWQCTTTALAWLGYTLHGRGYLTQASTAYQLAEMVQRQAHHHPKLYSVYGYNYAQLLLEQASCESELREVLARRQASLDIAIKLNHPLSQALDHCIIGLARAALGESDSVQDLNLAVTTMQRAGTAIHLPAMHLARAQVLRSMHDLPGARADLEVAYAIARRSQMRSYLAECAMLAANLHLDDARAADAATQHATAAQLIAQDGYGRRLAELHLLHARLLFAQASPAAVDALSEAQARICDTGQWYFRRALRNVAGEIAAPDPGECPPPPESTQAAPGKE